MPGESKHSPRRIRAAFKQAEALQLRLAGHTLAGIARQLGYRSPNSAKYAIESALKRTLQEPADQVRTLHLERLRSMLRAVWPQIESGDVKAISAGLAILDREAKLLGLDAPLKQEIRIEDLRARLKELAPDLPEDEAELAVQEAMRILKRGGA